LSVKILAICQLSVNPIQTLKYVQGITAPPPTAWGAGHGGKLWHGSPVCLLQNKITWSNFVISDKKLFDLDTSV
jgi:hypothetical protein